MDDTADVRKALERLIQAENQGGSAALKTAKDIISPDFLGITRASGIEQSRQEYLDQIANADQPEANNPLRWLDLADSQSAPDLVEPGVQAPRPGSAIRSGSIAIARAVVTTRTRAVPDTVAGRFRNLLIFDRSGNLVRLLAWHVTKLADNA